MKSKYLILLVLVSIFIGCSSSKTDGKIVTESVSENKEVLSKSTEKQSVKNTGNLKIQVMDEKGNLIPGEIILKSEESDYTKSKKGDNIEFFDIPNGLYSIQVKKDGFISTTKYSEIKGTDLEKKIKLKRRYPRITVIPTLDNEEVTADVEILKNGEIIEKDTGMFVDFKLKKGIYGIKVSGDYIISTTKYINVDNNNQDIEVKLRRGTTVKTNIRDVDGNKIEGVVELKKDGKVIEEKVGDSVEFNKIPKGMYEITVKKDGYLSTTKYIFVVGMLLEKEFTLRNISELTIIPMYQGKKVDAEVEISKAGKVLKKGIGKEYIYKLEDGIYEVKVFGDKFGKTTKYVSVKDDKKVKIPVEKVSNLTIKVVDQNQNPLKADIILKSEDKIIDLNTGAKVDFNNLKNGIYEVIIKNENYNSISKFININNEDQEIKIKIKK